MRESSEPQETPTPVFDVFVDETGTISADTDNEPYGYGWFVARRGARLDRLRAEIEASFGGGFHLKKYKSRQRKLSASRQLLNLVPEDRFFFGGGLVVDDPAYARRHHAGVLLEDISETTLREAVRLAEVPKGQILAPKDVMRPVHEVGRMMAVYLQATRLPIIALLNAENCPDPFRVNVFLGIVGESAAYHARLRLIADEIVRRKPKFMEEAYRRGEVPRVRCEGVDIETIRADADPAFAMADLLAGVARDAVLDSLGGALVEAARPVLDRVPWTPRGAVVRGISTFPLKASVE